MGVFGFGSLVNSLAASEETARAFHERDG